MRWSRLSVALALLGVVGVAACGDDDESGSVGVDPAAVVEGYVAAYNAQDIDRVMAFFADDAVVIAGSERIEGVEAIRAGELEKFTVHAPGGEAYSISNLVVAADIVTWDHLFKGTAHTCVGTGDEAVVKNGKIVKWTFASFTCE